MKHMKQKCTKCENTYSYPSKLKQHFNQVHLKIGRNQYGKQNNLYKINVENYFVWTFKYETAKNQKITHWEKSGKKVEKSWVKGGKKVGKKVLKKDLKIEEKKVVKNLEKGEKSFKKF